MAPHVLPGIQCRARRGKVAAALMPTPAGMQTGALLHGALWVRIAPRGTIRRSSRAPHSFTVMKLVDPWIVIIRPQTSTAPTIHTIVAHLGVNASTRTASLQTNTRAQNLQISRMSHTMAAFAALGTSSMKLHGTPVVLAMPTFAAARTGVNSHGATCHPIAAFLIILTCSAKKICTTVMKVAGLRIAIIIRTVQGVPMTQITHALMKIALASTRATPSLNQLLAQVTMQLDIPRQGPMVQVAPHGIRCQALHITNIATPMPSSAKTVGAKPRGAM